MSSQNWIWPPGGFDDSAYWTAVRCDGAAASGGGRGRGRSRRSSAIFADLKGVPPDELGRLIQSLQEEMHEAAKELRFSAIREVVSP